MLTLSNSASYAVKALSCMQGGEERPRFVKDIAAACGVPPAYLAKIFKKLVDAGILVSKRGWAGGTDLARPPGEIRVIEIVEALDGKEFLEGCLLGNEICSDERACPLHQFWKRERVLIAGELHKQTLAEVMAFEERRARARAKRPATA